MVDPRFRPATNRPDTPEVSVIIPCKGHPDVLLHLLRDLTEQQTDRAFEVIVVDAWSDDAIRTAAESQGVVVVRSGSGHLPGAARNLGADAARGPILAFIDADCRPDPGWVQAAADALEHGARLAAGPVADLAPWHPVARADNLLQFADLPRARPAGRMHMAPSCNLSIRKEDFNRLGGFRHRDGIATGEDVDFCERATALWRDGIQFSPGMAVRHAGRRRMADMLRHHRTFGYSRGRLRLLLSDRQARLARMRILAPAVVLRRLVYIIGRVARLSPAKLPMTLIISPLLLIGAFAWTAGFRSGLINSSPAGADAPASPGRRFE